MIQLVGQVRTLYPHQRNLQILPVLVRFLCLLACQQIHYFDSSQKCLVYPQVKSSEHPKHYVEITWFPSGGLTHFFRGGKISISCQRPSLFLILAPSLPRADLGFQLTGFKGERSECMQSGASRNNWGVLGAVSPSSGVRGGAPKIFWNSTLKYLKIP